MRLAEQRAAQGDARRQALLDQMRAQEEQYAQPYKMSNFEQAAALAKVTGALLSPTRGGGFMESFGAAGTAAAGPLAEAGKAERERQQKLGALQLARQKMALELDSGVPFDQMVRLEQLRQQERTKVAPEIKNIKLPDGTEMSVLYQNGRAFDLMGRPIDLDKMQQPQSSAQSREAAEASGIPAPTIDPFARITNVKEREKARLKERQDTMKRLDKEDITSPTSALEEANRKALRFLDLNNSVQSRTGPVVNYIPLRGKEVAEMNAISAEMARSMRQPGEGSTSDFDARMFQKMTLSTGQDYAVNRNIGLGLVGLNKAEMERREFMREYAENNGTLMNADRWWKAYSEANPVLKPRDAKNPYAVENVELNRSRKPYRDWFRDNMRGPKRVTRGPNGELVAGD
jgi:hypothetical protein